MACASVWIRVLLAMVCASASALAGSGHRDVASAGLASRACAALVARVDAMPGAGPVLLRSFDHATEVGPPDEPALATAAFAYDNALAVIALVACDQLTPAQRIGRALLRATMAGQLRNTYLAGTQAGIPAANGWWLHTQGQWVQDPYQTGIATGNAAWVALALLTLAERTGEPRWLAGAEQIASWVSTEVADPSGPGGFVGGLNGFDGQRVRLTWKSTEHNVDLVAVFDWLARQTGSRRWAQQAGQARRFVDAQFDDSTGRFFIGTLPDGQTTNRTVSGLDTQLWPQLLPMAAPRWRAAVTFAEHAHRVPGGFDFNDDRDGLWVEGTAQAGLVYQALGRRREYDACMAEVSRQFSTGGYLFATREPRISTGLAINPDSRTADLYYFRLPHLGATAWAAIAATAWNPFLGKRGVM